MAIDYGTKRVGIALTDPLFTFAYSYKTILNDSKFYKELSKIITEMSIIKIILGYPLKESGEEASLSKVIREFSIELVKRYEIEVIMWDERYSSSIAQERIIQTVTKKSKRRDKGLVDRNAASVLLEEYLAVFNKC